MVSVNSEADGTPVELNLANHTVISTNIQAQSRGCAFLVQGRRITDCAAVMPSASSLDVRNW